MKDMTKTDMPDADDTDPALSFLKAELARRTSRLEELEREKDATESLIAIAGVVSRVFRQNIGNMDARDPSLVDAARALNAKQAWLAQKFFLAEGLPDITEELTAGAAENNSARSAWLASFDIKSPQELFKVIVEYQFQISHIPEAYRGLFVPAALFSEYFNAALLALETRDKAARAKVSRDLREYREKLSNAIRDSRAEREAAFSIILGVFPENKSQDIVEVDDTASEAGALAKFIRESRI